LESIGDKLRSVREAKKLSVRDVAKDTNIAPRYIEALEAEEFDRFPGETYIIGFLRSYSEYLKVDADSIIQSYKGYKIGESVTPLEELTRPTRSDLLANVQNAYRNYRYAFIAGGAVLVLILGVMTYGIFKSTNVSLATDDSINKIKKEYDKNGESGLETIHHLKLPGGKEIVLVYRNEAFQFVVDAKESMVVVREIKENEVSIQILPQKQNETLVRDMPKSITIPGAAHPVILTLKGLTEGRANIRVEVSGATVDPDDAAQKTADQAKPVQGDQTTVTAQNPQNLKIVFEAEFTAKTYIEVYLDGAEKTKGVVLPGRRERWEANGNIQLKIGNAGGVKARINGSDYTFGYPGQVANKVISWKRDQKNPNQYQINVRDWY
jgi:transcriptional regulator with XRE-family HTH domain